MRRCRSAEVAAIALLAIALPAVALPAFGAVGAAWGGGAAPPTPQGFPEVDRLLATIGESDLRIDLLEAWLATLSPREHAAEREAVHRGLMATLRRHLREAPLAEVSRRLDRAEALRGATATATEQAALRREIALFKGVAATAEAGWWRERSRFDPAAAEAPEAIERLAAWLEQSAIDLEAEAARLENHGRGGTSGGGSAREPSAAGEIARWRLLAGWSWLERARLDGDRIAAQRGEALLLPLLDAGVPDPRPVEISLDLRADPGFSRALLGMALARTMTRSLEEGLRWLRLLDAPPVEARLREERRAWALELHLLGDDPDGGLRVLEEWGDLDGVPVSGSTLRRAAAAAIDRSAADARWGPLATGALLQLLDREAFAEVVQLAPSPEEAARHRAGGSAEDRFVDAALIALHRVERSAPPGEAATLLEHAAAAPGATPRAAAGLLLLALEQRLAGDAPIEAALSRFDAARFAALSADAQARAAWWRVAALQRAAAEGTRPRDAWREAADDFLQQAPQHPAAPLLRLQLEGDRMSPRQIAVAAAAAGEGVWQAAARSQAIELLLAGVRSGDASRRRASAEVLRELLPPAPEWDAPVARLAVAEALLASATTPAERVLAEALLSDAPPGWAARAPEHAALPRRLAILQATSALARGDLGAAEAAWQRSEPRSQGEWLGLLASAWEATPTRLDLADAIALLPEASGEWAPLAVGPAAAAWQEAPTQARADRWLAIARAAADRVGETDRAVATAEVAAAAAAARSWAVLLEHARRLLALHEAGSEAWLDAKRFQLEALEQLDPQRAGAVLRQHQALRPQWREQRHGGWFEALARRLGASIPEPVR